MSSHLATTSILLLSAALLCGASECEEEGACAQGPQGPLSAWSECELYGQDQTIWIHLTNEASPDTAFLQACEGPLTMEMLGEGGAFVPLPPPVTCVSGEVRWEALPSPGEIEAAAWPVLMEEGTSLPPGTYRGAYQVGWGCALGIAATPAEAACDAVERLHTAPFTVLPPSGP